MANEWNEANAEEAKARRAARVPAAGGADPETRS